VKAAKSKVKNSDNDIKQINDKIDSTLIQKETYKNSIVVLEESKNNSTKNKETFVDFYNQNLLNFMKGLNVIKDESPYEAQLVKDIEQCPKNSSITECSIRKILPL